MPKQVFISGTAGFIGFHLAKRLLDDGYAVTGLDNFNAYYDPSLKESRWAELTQYQHYQGHRLDLMERDRVLDLVASTKPETLIHLAAQAGVRYSLENPQAYVDSNITGFLTILEAARAHPPRHLIYASSSSVYGANRKMPFATKDPVDHPISLYAATKKSNEMMAHTYASLFNVPTTGLRFFTVYGPWGRPDMALFKFLNKMTQDQVIDIYNHGDMARDFTYIDDIVESICRLMPKAPVAQPEYDMQSPCPSNSYAPHRLYNIGRSKPEKLMDVVHALEEASGITARKNFTDMQPGDVLETHADVEALESITGFAPQVCLKDGIKAFVDWYFAFYGKRSG